MERWFRPEGHSLELVLDDLGGCAGGQIDIADEKGDFVVLVEAFPQLPGQGGGVRGGYRYLTGLTLERGKGVPVFLIRVDEICLLYTSPSPRD